MTLILWIIAISGILTLFVIASTGRLFDEIHTSGNEISPGAEIPKALAEKSLSSEDQVAALIRAAQEKANTDFYSRGYQDRTSVIADRLSKLEAGIFKIKMQLFVFGMCLGAVSFFFTIWAAIVTIVD